MKKIILTIVLVSALFAGNVCDSIATMSKLVMMKRQQGAMMQDMLKIADSIENKDVKQTYTKIVISAYKEPKVDAFPDLMNETINEFTNRWYMR